MVFSTKKGLLECKPEWNREAVTVSPDFLAWGDCKPLLHYKLPYSRGGGPSKRLPISVSASILYLNCKKYGGGEHDPQAMALDRTG